MEREMNKQTQNTIWALESELRNHKNEIARLKKPEPAWMTDIVGYGQFVDGKLVACSQSEMHIAIGGENVECRPLYSVQDSK